MAQPAAEPVEDYEYVCSLLLLVEGLSPHPASALSRMGDETRLAASSVRAHAWEVDEKSTRPLGDFGPIELTVSLAMNRSLPTSPCSRTWRQGRLPASLYVFTCSNSSRLARHTRSNANELVSAGAYRDVSDRCDKGRILRPTPRTLRRFGGDR